MNRLKMLAIFAMLSLYAFFPKAEAQEIVSPAGKHFSNETMQISWTLGEPVINTFQGESKMLTQGFHQSKLIVTAVNEMPELALDIKAYPNPTTNFLKVEVKNEGSPNLHYTLYNMEGKVLSHKPIDHDISEISMINYAPSTYFLKISENSRELKTFKIIKR